jgi:hypothetical protein
MRLYKNLIVCFGIILTSCGTNSQVQESDKSEQAISVRENKINGLSFVASSQPYAKGELEILKQTNANHLAIMPFGFMATLKSSAVSFDHERQWWGERTDGCIETIKQCKEDGFEIMLKPQIWIGGGDFTGFIEMDSDENWKEFEQNYAKFILHFAEVAEKTKVEIFCVGTELGRFVAARPAFWDELISDIRVVYKGKLTYAENWDCFDKPKFLKDLDFIGVDAYFPLSDKKTPSEEEIRVGWKKHILDMETCSNKIGKPILFTECGYRSIDFAASKPWDFDHSDADVNEVLQDRLLKVMFELWDKDWMAGGYIWKWFPFHNRAGGDKDDQFTPQNKLAEKRIVEFYKK